MKTLIRHFILLLAFLVAASQLSAQRAKPAITDPIDREAERERMEKVLKDRYIVVFKKSLPDRQAAAARIRAKGGKVRRQFQRLRGASVQLTQDQRKALAADPDVAYIEPDQPVFLDDLPDGAPIAPPDDLRYGEMWALENNGQTGGMIGADIDAPGAWNLTTGSSDVVVAVIDTGVDRTHPDLAPNMWTNAGEIAGNGVDDDGNGFVDDVHGWDFIDLDNDPMDGDDHGTHVAGTIAASGNNGIGITGISWSSRIMALKMFPDGGGSGSLSAGIEAIEYAAANGARVINASWGAEGFSQALEDAIDASGVVFVTSAGNEGFDTDATPRYPQSSDSTNLLAVVNLTDDDTMSSSSCYGAQTVDLGAPGTSILSTVPGAGYALKSGTSMASPHVAGVAALVLARYPTLEADEVVQIIMNSVDPIPGLEGLCVSGGRVNAARAVSGSPPAGPIADDGFESGNSSGGSGWAGSWSFSGDYSLTSSGTPHAGSRHLRLRRSTGLAQRNVDLSGVAVPGLGFWAKVYSFESSDTASVKVDGITIQTFTKAQSDNSYRYYEFDLTQLALSGVVPITFDANMSATSDYFYIDNIQVLDLGGSSNIAISSPASEGYYSPLDQISFAATAINDQGADVSASLVWTSDRDGQLGTGTGFTNLLSVGRHTIEAAANGECAHVRTIVVNFAPEIEITSPNNDDVFLPGATLDLLATVTDPEGENLFGAVEWFVESNSSGLVEPVGSAAFGDGVHTLTASVEDSFGGTDSEMVSIYQTSIPTFSSDSRPFGPTDENGDFRPAETNRALEMVDIDGDGDLDIALNNNPGYFDEVYLNDGNGNFPTDAASRIVIGRDAAGNPMENDGLNVLVFTDVDQDGDPDAIVENADQLYVALYDSDNRTFTRGNDVGPLPAYGAYDVVAGDLNGDGWPDVVSGHFANAGSPAAARIHFNLGGGVFASSPVEFYFLPEIEDFLQTRALALADVDGDGDLDLAIGGGRTQAWLYVNDGSGIFSDAARVAVGDGLQEDNVQYSGLTFGDIDGVNGPDIVAVHMTGQNAYYLNDGSGGFGPAVRFGHHRGVNNQVALGDLDGDGLVDAVVANTGKSPNTTSFGLRSIVYFNDPDPELRFTRLAPFADGMDYQRSVGLGDVNGDGSLDIAVGIDSSSSAPRNNVVLINPFETEPNEPPSLTITSPADGIAVPFGIAVNLIGSATDAEDGDLSAAIAWFSDRDGVLGAGGSVSAAALSAGSHSITASVTDSRGESAQQSIVITVAPAPNDPPVANAGDDQSGTDNDGDGVEIVTLDGSGSVDVDGTIASYTWTENGSTIATGSNLTLGLPVGLHTITLTVIDDDGASDSDELLVTIAPDPNAPPVADAGTDQVLVDSDDSGAENVTLDGSGSTDADGNIVSYEWREGGNLIATGASPTLGLAVGVHNLTLTVTDAFGESDSANVTVTVDPNTPAEPVVIASDGFESRNYSGGSGWSGGWAATGDVTIRINRDGPHSGSSHLRLRRNTGFVVRSADLSGVSNSSLRFWAKVDSFEGSDSAAVRVSADGANFTTVKTFTSSDSDNSYHLYEIDLSGFAMTADFQIAFDANMSGTGDRWYLDDIEIVGNH